MKNKHMTAHDRMVIENGLKDGLSFKAIAKSIDTGSNILNKIRKYILNSSPCPKKTIITVLNLSESYFSTCI